MGWMITTFPVFSSGPELKYVLFWNGTVILVAIGFSASSSAFSLVSDVWPKHGAAVTMMVAVTQRQLGRRECIADQPFRSANQFRAEPWPTPHSVNGVIVNTRGDTRLSMQSPRCGEHGEPEKSLAEEKQESGETESLRP
jgi:hypothetical protein